MTRKVIPLVIVVLSEKQETNQSRCDVVKLCNSKEKTNPFDCRLNNGLACSYRPFTFVCRMAHSQDKSNQGRVLSGCWKMRLRTGWHHALKIETVG